MCLAHDHGLRRGCVGYGLLDTHLLFEPFWSGSWNVQSLQNVFVNASRKCDKNRTIRKKNNGFQSMSCEVALSISGFTC